MAAVRGASLISLPDFDLPGDRRINRGTSEPRGGGEPPAAAAAAAGSPGGVAVVGATATVVGSSSAVSSTPSPCLFPFPNQHASTTSTSTAITAATASQQQNPTRRTGFNSTAAPFSLFGSPPPPSSSSSSSSSSSASVPGGGPSSSLISRIRTTPHLPRGQKANLLESLPPPLRLASQNDHFQQQQQQQQSGSKSSGAVVYPVKISSVRQVSSGFPPPLLDAFQGGASSSSSYQEAGGGIHGPNNNNSNLSHSSRRPPPVPPSASSSLASSPSARTQQRRLSSCSTPSKPSLVTAPFPHTNNNPQQPQQHLRQLSTPVRTSQQQPQQQQQIQSQQQQLSSLLPLSSPHTLAVLQRRHRSTGGQPVFVGLAKRGENGISNVSGLKDLALHKPQHQRRSVDSSYFDPDEESVLEFSQKRFGNELLNSYHNNPYNTNDIFHCSHIPGSPYSNNPSRQQQQQQPQHQMNHGRRHPEPHYSPHALADNKYFYNNNTNNDRHPFDSRRTAEGVVNGDDGIRMGGLEAKINKRKQALLLEQLINGNNNTTSARALIAAIGGGDIDDCGAISGGGGGGVALSKTAVIRRHTFNSEITSSPSRLTTEGSTSPIDLAHIVMRGGGGGLGSPTNSLMAADKKYYNRHLRGNKYSSGRHDAGERRNGNDDGHYPSNNNNRQSSTLLDIRRPLRDHPRRQRSRGRGGAVHDDDGSSSLGSIDRSPHYYGGRGGTKRDGGRGVSQSVVGADEHRRQQPPYFRRPGPLLAAMAEDYAYARYMEEADQWGGGPAGGMVARGGASGMLMQKQPSAMVMGAGGSMGGNGGFPPGAFGGRGGYGGSGAMMGGGGGSLPAQSFLMGPPGSIVAATLGPEQPGHAERVDQLTAIASRSMLTCSKDFKTQFPNVYSALCKGLLDVNRLIQQEIVVPIKEEISIHKDAIRCRRSVTAVIAEHLWKPLHGKFPDPTLAPKLLRRLSDYFFDKIEKGIREAENERSFLQWLLRFDVENAIDIRVTSSLGVEMNSAISNIEGSAKIRRQKGTLLSLVNPDSVTIDMDLVVKAIFLNGGQLAELNNDPIFIDRVQASENRFVASFINYY